MDPTALSAIIYNCLHWNKLDPPVVVLALLIAVPVKTILNGLHLEAQLF